MLDEEDKEADAFDRQVTIEEEHFIYSLTEIRRRTTTLNARNHGLVEGTNMRYGEVLRQERLNCGIY